MQRFEAVAQLGPSEANINNIINVPEKLLTYYSIELMLQAQSREQLKNLRLLVMNVLSGAISAEDLKMQDLLLQMGVKTYLTQRDIS